MLRAITGHLRLSFKQNFLTAFSAAFVTVFFSTITLPPALRWHSYLAFAFLYLACAYLFLEFLWLPLTWCRRRFQGKAANVFLVSMLALLLLGGTCLIFPGNLLHMLFREITPAVEWRTEFVVILLHAVFAFFFFSSLRHVRLFATPPPRRGALAGEAPVQPNLLLNGLSFIFGLYFVTIFAWWMVNLQHTFALQQPFVVLPPAEKMRELLKSDPQNFLDLPALFQPYEALFAGTSDSTAAQPGSAPVDSSGSTEQLHGAAPQEGKTLPRLQSQAPLAPGGRIPGLFLPVISVALSGMFLMFIGGIVPLRLMSNILLAVRDHEAAHNRRLRQTLTYTGQFVRAIIAQNPLFSISSLIVILFLIVVPLLIEVGGNRGLLLGLIGPDQILFIFTLVAAWLSPLIYAGVQVDRTFGTYFNTKLANLILSMRGHLVVLGFGDLGQRVVKRELAKLLHREAPELHWWQQLWLALRRAAARPSRYFLQRKWLERTVSPELNIESVCNNVIVVDRNSDNFVFAAAAEVLGSYGVVSAWESVPEFDRNRFAMPEPGPRPRGKQAQRLRVLVPVIQGDATEPFTLARVNLERARFLISMVSQEERVRDIFTHAAECGLRAIVCVSRSDQINNLTYKALHYPITLVYPKQHSGLALGQRLLAAALKVRSRLPADREYPRIMVIGLNKSNHFMLETLWHSWPVADDHRKAEIFANMLRFVVTDEPPRSATFEARPPAATLSAPQEQGATISGAGSPAASGQKPAPASEPPSALFNRSWRSSYITGFRHAGAGPEKRPLSVEVPTCVMRMDEGSVLERCCNEARPDIIVINDDNAGKSSALVIRCVNTLERLKYEHGDFRFPLILMSAAHGEEAEKRDLGDAFRYYDALTRLYGDYPGPEHPRHAHYRREPPRRLVGDSIHDGLADAEEIISGVRDSWLLADEYQAHAALSGSSPSEVYELNTCLPNVAGTLAELAGRLAGLEFSYRADESPEEFFARAGRTETAGEGAAPKILRPSFQYLRHMRLEVPGSGFCLSGYADLQENDWAEVLAEECLKDSELAARVYAKENRFGPEDQEASSLAKLLQLVAGAPPAKTEAKTFVEVMHGTTNGTAHDDYCPGMTICPIASFQHYLVASNGKVLADWREDGRNGPLQNAVNYSCSRLTHLAPLRRPHNRSPHYARIFCCCHVDRNDPGMVALALNLLNFRRFAGLYRRAEREKKLNDDWIVNLEYFKDTACQNNRFALNRVFGVRRQTSQLLKENRWTLDDYEDRFKTTLPLTLIQIMPVGGPEVAWRWFDYGVALLRFMQNIAPPAGVALGARQPSETPRAFELHWWDQHAQRRDELDLSVASPDYPVAIQINNKPREAPRANQCCEFCEAKDEDMRLGCAARRPWMEDDR